jgi:hypothetical protein
MQRSPMLRAALALLATIGWMVWGSPSFGGTSQETLSRANGVPLACAADGLSKKFCDLMLNLHRP